MITTGIFRISILLLFCVLAAACEKNEPGVVAVINGEPVTMRELQARHDLDHMSWSGQFIPSAEELQSQYGDSLVLLIVNHLVMQELEELEQSVSDEELRLAEKEIRGGYGDEEFISILEDEAIDLEMWRIFLRQRLSMQKFMQTALRAQVSISPEEVSAYYEQNIDEFRLPARYHFWELESSSESDLAEFIKAREKAGLDPTEKLPSNIRMREVRLRKDRLTPEWVEILKNLEPGHFSKVFAVNNEFETVFLLEILEPSELSMAQAYPLIERNLVEKNLETVFENWLAERIAQLDIQIASSLAHVWIPYRLAPDNATSPADMPWTWVEEDFSPDLEIIDEKEGETSGLESEE
ncbi:MAG: peptidyl-prolyl cis-trans isomerase [Desulfovibrionaceae bacterium]|nr:peptidyl-prolyl cis-trans isomerase [Desulfovibrionaceae bacterium]